MTDLSGAIDHAAILLLTAPYAADRSVINVIGNGWDNPIAGMTDASNLEHNKKNRRVEVTVVKGNVDYGDVSAKVEPSSELAKDDAPMVNVAVSDCPSAGVPAGSGPSSNVSATAGGSGVLGPSARPVSRGGEPAVRDGSELATST